MKLSLTIVFLQMIFIGCNFDQSNNSGSDNDSSIGQDQKIYTGLDINGNFKSCSEMDGEIACTLIFGPDEEFASECNNSGLTAITCDCHDYICVENIDEVIVYGMDIEGNLRGCEGIDKNKYCTEIFTPEDKFALDCENRGSKAFQCDCHDFICLE